jgi:hypothetical protein
LDKNSTNSEEFRMNIELLGVVFTFDTVTAAGALLALLGAISVLVANARATDSDRRDGLVRQRARHTAGERR